MTENKPKKSTKKVKPKITAEQFLLSVPPKPEGHKHVVECKCFLPQFNSTPNPPTHKFIVFSELDEYANVKPSYVQCNNCGIVHKVIEIGTSLILKKEDTSAIVTIDELADQLPDWLKGILQRFDCDLPTWQEAQFIYINKLWGRFVVVVRERAEENVFGKILIILGENLHKIETFEREE